MRTLSSVSSNSHAMPTFTPVPRGLLQRSCACGAHAGGGECSKCSEKKNALRHGGKHEVDANPSMSSVGDVLSTPGTPLDPASRAFMEPRFGQDFGHVRVHTDPRAAQSAREMNANAYTVGDHIVFGSRYSPGTARGDRLLAHELTHVVQQSVGGSAGPHFSKILSERSDTSEIEAEASAERVMSGGPVQITQPASALVQGDIGIGEAIGIGAAVAGGLGLLGLGIAALAGAFSRNRWSISQTNKDGTPYESDVSLTFNPDKDTMNCSEIAFVQAVKFMDAGTRTSVETIPNLLNRRTTAGWTLDRIDQRRYGWYGYNNNGRPSGTVTPGSSPTPLRSATMGDTPRDSTSNAIMQFETCAICRAGTDVNKVYSCYHWGFSADASNHLESLPNSEAAAPSAEFAESVRQWNVQAAGPAATRNDPNQAPLGPFR